MTDDLTKAAERARQNRAARTSEAPTVDSLRAARIVSAAATFRVGDRVLDVATGQLGTVTGAGFQDQLQNGDVRVRLDDGRDVVRGAFAVLFRPNGV